MQFLGKAKDHRPAHVDFMFTQLSTFCSTVTVHHKTCSVSVSAHGQANNGSQEKVLWGQIKNAFFVSYSSSSSATVELDSIFASDKKHRESGYEKVGLIVHGKMSFLFTTEHVKIRLQLQILC